MKRSQPPHNWLPSSSRQINCSKSQRGRSFRYLECISIHMVHSLCAMTSLSGMMLEMLSSKPVLQSPSTVRLVEWEQHQRIGLLVKKKIMKSPKCQPRLSHQDKTRLPLLLTKTHSHTTLISMMMVFTATSSSSLDARSCLRLLDLAILSQEQASFTMHPRTFEMKNLILRLKRREDCFDLKVVTKINT